MRRLATVIAIAALLSPAATAGRIPAHKQSWQYKWQVWLPPVWQRIGACETGYGKRPGDWTWNSGLYQGAFGFHRDSWDDYRYPGYPSEAYLATPWQQYRVALRIHARFGFTGWGCYINRAWVRG